MEKVSAALIEALKQALAAAGEQRLYRSGKLPGLFASRGGASAEAAARAVRDGLLEVVRSEVRGKTIIEWVRATPAGVRFLHEHESPLAALQELRATLRQTREGLPDWLAEIRRSLDALAARLTAEVDAVARRLEALGGRVDEALRRAGDMPLTEEAARVVPWAREALGHLEHRRGSGATAPCPLSELFAALREQHGEMTLSDFHSGLRRLHDRGLMRLLPQEAANGAPEPEFALLDGVATYYFVAAGRLWPPTNGAR
jgi:hypothetical protein